MEWPAWIGTPSQAGVLIIAIVALLRWSLPWRKMSIDEGTQIRQELRAEITKVRSEHKICEDELASTKKEVEELRDEVNNLEERILGMRRQHVQEQISLVAAIIASVPDPSLRKLLMALESVQRNLPTRIMEDLKHEGLNDGKA